MLDNYSKLNNYVVALSVAHNINYIETRFAMFERSATLEKRIIVCGHGRSGKDTASQILAKRLGYRFSGSTSQAVLPLITYSIYGYIDQETLADCYEQRHVNRGYWFDYCNMLRTIDPFMLLKLSLSYSDILSGTRSCEELANGVALFNPTHVLWIHRDVPKDPTLEYDRDFACDLVSVTSTQFVDIYNDGSLLELTDQLESI